MASDILTELANDLVEAEEWLLNYKARLRQWQQDSNSIREESNAPEVYVRTGPNKNIIIQKVVSLEELNKTENWLLAVEFFEKTIDYYDRLFLEIRRQAHQKCKEQHVRGRPAWRGYVITKWAESMPDKLSEDRVSDWWKQLVELMRLIGLKRGVL